MGQNSDRDGRLRQLPQGPVGTWEGKTYRITIDGDCHTYAYRKDYFGEGAIGGAEVPKTWQQVNQVSKDLLGKTDPLTGQPAFGYLDPLKGWGGFGFYFLENRATAYVKHPADPAWLFDPDTMKPRVNNPGWVQAIQDVMDLIAGKAYPADQINADPGTTAFSQFLAGTGSMLTWWGDVGSNARTSDSSVVGDVVGFGINPGSDRVYNAKAGAWEETYNESPNMAYLGWGIYVTSRVSGDEKKRKAAWSAAAHLGGKDLSLWTSAYPSGFQPYRNSHFQYDEWAAAGYDKALSRIIWARTSTAITTPMRRSNPASPASSNTIRWPRMNWPRAMLANTKPPKKPPMRLQRHGRRSRTQIGRDSQIKLYKASLGM